VEALLWILLPGFVAVAAGVLAWFVMQSRMEVALANQRESMAEARGTIEAERAAIKSVVPKRRARGRRDRPPPGVRHFSVKSA
jgi:hypothetical protein